MSIRLALLLSVPAALLAGPAMAQNAPNPNQVAGKALLEAANKAIGASNVKSFTVAGTGRMGYPGQQFGTADLPQTDIKNVVFSADYGSKASRFEYTRVQGNNLPRGGGAGFPVAGEQNFKEGVNGAFSWIVNQTGATVPQPAQAGDRYLYALAHPVGFINAGLAAPNAAATDRYFSRGNKTVKVVAFSTKVCDGPQPACTRRLTGEFNSDNQLDRVVTWVPDPVLGDKMVEIRWSDYKDVGGGVKMPFRAHAHNGDHPLIPGGHNWFDLRATDVKVNVADAAPAVPDAVRNAPAPQERVVATTMAPGVVHMGGGSHNSVAVEFKDFVAMIEAPLSQARSLAVIAEVKKTWPNKPIRYVVNTHNHFDHLGGVRTYAAEGATLITDERNKAFYEQVVLAPQPRSLQPDRLSQRPFAPTGPGQRMIQTFTDHYTITDGDKVVELHHVEGFNHSDNMSIVYLPKEKILISADMGGPLAPGAAAPPPASVSANSIALLRNIQRLKLDVATHAPIHGPTGAHADFARYVAPAAAAAPPAGGGG